MAFNDTDIAPALDVFDDVGEGSAISKPYYSLLSVLVNKLRQNYFLFSVNVETVFDYPHRVQLKQPIEEIFTFVLHPFVLPGHTATCRSPARRGFVYIGSFTNAIRGSANDEE